MTAPFDQQATHFPHGLWHTFYRNMGIFDEPFDLLLCMFAAQYANQSPQSWADFVRMVNSCSKVGSRFVVSYIDADRITEPSEYCRRLPSGLLEVKLPHRDLHTEPALGTTQMLQSFVADGTWAVIALEGTKKILRYPQAQHTQVASNRSFVLFFVLFCFSVSAVPSIDARFPIAQYGKLMNGMVLERKR